MRDNITMTHIEMSREDIRLWDNGPYYLIWAPTQFLTSYDQTSDLTSLNVAGQIHMQQLYVSSDFWSIL